MDRGEIDLDGLERVVQQLTAETFADRAERLKNYLGETTIAGNEQALAELVFADEVFGVAFEGVEGEEGHGEGNAELRMQNAEFKNLKWKMKDER